MATAPEKAPGLPYLIYVSYATIRLSQNDLLELLKKARVRNEARGLTGMLLYRDGRYLQFLEGQRADIDELLGRLRDDRRHKAIRTLREGTVPERLFPDWSMAYKNLTGLRSSHVPGYSEHFQGYYIKKPGKNAAQSLIDMFRETPIDT
jgi:Sensors of blue-light using FAD